MRVKWDIHKNKVLMRTRGLGFEEAVTLFEKEYVIQNKNDFPEQYKAIGFTRTGALVSLIVGIRSDDHGEYEWLVTFWISTKDEAKIYEQNI
jgi:uncharacterized DUF497 family protein